MDYYKKVKDAAKDVPPGNHIGRGWGYNGGWYYTLTENGDDEVLPYTSTWLAKDWNNKKVVKVLYGGGLKESDLKVTPKGDKVNVLVNLAKGQRITFLMDTEVVTKPAGHWEGYE